MHNEFIILFQIKIVLFENHIKFSFNPKSLLQIYNYNIIKTLKIGFRNQVRQNKSSITIAKKN